MYLRLFNNVFIWSIQWHGYFKIRMTQTSKSQMLLCTHYSVYVQFPSKCINSPGKHVYYPTSIPSPNKHWLNNQNHSFYSKSSKKLANWKGPSLSHAGRSVLLKSVCSNLPNYWSPHQYMPKRITNLLNPIWVHSNGHAQVKNGKHITPISRKKVTKPLNQGGPGIRNLENQTKAWWVRILT